MAVIKRVSDAVFKTCRRDESVEGSNSYLWKDTTTNDIFAGISLPGRKLLYSLCLGHSQRDFN